MVKGYSLCGVHGVGKTTIAADVAEALGIEFVPTKTTDVFKKLEVSPQDILSPGLRLEIQWRILDSAIELWGNQDRYWITDRTPLDFIAYTINDSFIWEDEYYVSYLTYKETCLKVLKEFFDKTFLIQPDGVIWDRDSTLKGRNSRVLQQSMNTVYRGLLTEVGDLPYTVIREDASSSEKKIEVFDSLLQELHCRGK